MEMKFVENEETLKLKKRLFKFGIAEKVDIILSF
jgi:hypothetical protein